MHADYMDPACKIAIVTGGATGIGFAACNQLLSEGASHVVMGGNVPKDGKVAVKKLNNMYGQNKASFFPCDVTSQVEFDALFRETLLRFRQVDILFNNAGMLDEKKWELSIDTNIKGVIRGCFLAFRYMGKDQCGHGGVVVNTASIAGLQPMASAPGYSCSKHAVIGITKCLGDEFHCSRNGIRMCSLCPGTTRTNLTTGENKRQYNEAWDEKTEQNPRITQDPDVVGRAFTYIVRHGHPASHYIAEGGLVLHVEFPHRHSFSEVLTSYKEN